MRYRALIFFAFLSHFNSNRDDTDDDAQDADEQHDKVEILSKEACD